MRGLKLFVLGVVLLLAAGSVCLADDSVSTIWLDVKEFRLNNGMMFLIVERPTTPQVACRVSIRTGSALEETRKTGLAHMLEHMMFKGTKNFGTVDIKRDQELQERIEAAYQTVLAEENKRNPNQEVIRSKLKEMNRLRTEVQKIYIPHAFSSQLEKNGAVGVNAFTTNDQTQYISSIPSDMIEQWFSIISEQLFEPSWREFYVEKEVVQREWAFRYINSPEGAAWLDLFATAYDAHPYRNPIIGWKSDMEKYNSTDAIAFHKTYYNPANAVCVLVGDIQVKEAETLAKLYFERYPAGKRAPEEVTNEPPQHGPRKSIRFLEGARTPVVRIGFHTTRMGTKDFYALDALSMTLSNGHSARMRKNILDKGFAVQAWAGNPDNRYGGIFVMGGSPNEPDEIKNNDLAEQEKRQAYVKDCEGLEKVLLSETEKLKTELVSTSELKRIKKLNQRSFLDMMRSNEQLASSLATSEVQVGWRYMTTYLEKFDEITPEDIRRVAKKYILTDNKTSAYVIPGGMPDYPPETYTEIRSADRPFARKTFKPDILTNKSVYPTPEGWKHPLSFERKPEKIQYPKAETEMVGDTTVFYLPDRELPLIDLAILVKAGAVDVDDTKIGLPGILNSCLIRGGTEKYSPSELALALDQDAIRVSLSVQEEETVIRLSVMKDDWEKGLALLEEILTRPRFDPDVLDVVKQQELISLNRQAGDALAVSMRESKIWHFKGHPYGRDPLTGLNTIPAITRDDLRGFLKDYLVPTNMVAAIAGDIEKAEAVDGLRELFQALTKVKAPVRKTAEPAERPPILALIHKPGQVQSQVALCLSGIKRTDPNYWKMSLLMDIFGGSGSIMYTRLRDDLGLIYAGGFYQTFKWEAGILMGYIGCKGDKTAQAIAETVEIMTSLKDNVPQEDLDQKRLDALNGFVFNVDTPFQLVETYANYYMRKEPLDTLERIQDAFMSASKEELEVLSKRFLDPKKLQVFVVGDKATPVKKKDGTNITLEEDLNALAKKLGLPYKEIALR